MNVFLDENLNLRLCGILGDVAPFHTFEHANDLKLRNVEDTALFSRVVEKGFDLMITDDRRQLKVDSEFQALRDSGLHWATIKKSNLAGLPGLSADAAALVSCLPHLEEIVMGSERPQLIRLYRGRREKTQLLRHMDL